MKRITLALALCAPTLATADELVRDVAVTEALDRKNVVPKLDLMCGIQLDIHFDPKMSTLLASEGVDFAGTRLCEMPLRWLFYICGTEEGRRVVSESKLHRYECRLESPTQPVSTTLDKGVAVFTWPAHRQKTSEQIDELSMQLLQRKGVSYRGLEWKDPLWDAFAASPPPAITRDNYCEVDGKKMPLPPTGVPVAPKTARIRCMSSGKLVTDLTPSPGGYTGFATAVDGDNVTFRSWRKGFRDGDSWERTGKIVYSRERHDNGELRMSATFYSKTGAPHSRELRTSQANTSSLVFDERGVITRLHCMDGADTDEVFRDYCGYDKPKKVQVKESYGMRTYTYDKGEIVDSD